MGRIARGSEQAMIRMPDGMRDELRAVAERNGRSMNAEIVARLENSLRLSSDMIVNAILGFRESLLSQGLSFTFKGDDAEMILAESKRLNMTPDEYFNLLVNRTLDHLEKDTPLGKKLREELSKEQ